MSPQEVLAENAINAADKCAQAGNHANEMHFVRLAAAHLEIAAKRVKCVRGIPVNPEERTRISGSYRRVLSRIMEAVR